MLIADVIGTVVSPIQHPLLEGRSLLLLRPLTPEGKPTGPTRIGIDNIGIVTSRGRQANPIITVRVIGSIMCSIDQVHDLICGICGT